MGHVLARLTGFGMTLVPVWPYNLRRSAPASDDVVVTRGAGAAAHSVTVRVGRNMPAGDRDVDQVVDVLDGPAERVWRIETSLYSVEWPEDFEIGSPPEGDTPPFLLWGPDEAMIYIQGPITNGRVPPLPELAGPGQTIVDHRSDPRSEVVALAYRHDGAEWSQSHHLMPFGADHTLVVTAQSPLAHAALTRRAAETVARTVTPAL